MTPSAHVDDGGQKETLYSDMRRATVKDQRMQPLLLSYTE